MKKLLPCICILFIVSCDPSSGNLSRYTNLDSSPPMSCIDSVLRNDIEEITEVKYEHSKGGIPITLTGLKKPDDVHSFFYKGENIWAQLLITIDYKGDVHFSQSQGYIGTPPDQKSIYATRPVMKKVEKVLQEKCGITNLTTKIKEDCYKVDCP